MRASSMRRRWPPDERAELLLHDLLRQAERGGHGNRLGLGRVAAALSKSCMALSYRVMALLITSGSGSVISFSALRMRLMMVAMSRALIMRSSAVCVGSEACVSCGR